MLLSAAGRDAESMLTSIGSYIDARGVSIVEEDTCRFRIEYDEAGEVLGINANYGAANRLNAILQEAALPDGHYHVCCRKPLSPQYVLPRLMARYLPFSLDFVSTSAEENIRIVSSWISVSQFVFVNRREFEMLQSVRRIDDLPELIVTAGSGPVCVYHFGREVGTWECPARRFEDVTGAGDVFIGTFMATRLLGGDVAFSVGRAIAQAQRSIDGLGVWGILTPESKAPR